MKVLLFSGGMDSLITYFYLKDQLQISELALLNVMLGHTYQSKEIKAVNFLREYLDLPVRIVEFPLGRYEKVNAEIPQRNLFLAQIALLEFPKATEVFLALQKGETRNESNDRSPEFLKKASEMLSHLYGRKILVSSPILHATKRDLFLWFYENYEFFFVKESLGVTVSCYSATGWLCGTCSACLRRYAATFPELEEEYKTNPVVGNFDKVVKWYIPEMKRSLNGEGRYDPARAEQFLSFLDLWSNKYKEEFPKHAEEIKRYLS